MTDPGPADLNGRPGAPQEIPSCPQQEALLQELAGVLLVEADLTEAWRAVTVTLAPGERLCRQQTEIRDEDGGVRSADVEHEETSQLVLLVDALREECAQHGIAWQRLRLLAERDPEDLDRIGISAEPID